jgi:Ca2+-binding RTX toxin-like protein
MTRPKRPLCFDDLETRQVMSAPYINVVNHVLQIVGNSDENKAVVNVSRGKVTVTMSSTNTDGFYLVDPTTTIKHSFKTSAIREIKFWGYANDDSFVNNWNIKSTAYGGSGNDYLEGANKTDFFYGGSGDDTMLGYGGYNYMDGGSGTDSAKGAALNQMPNCEIVQITGIPGGQPQAANKCGPNSAWRVMNALGGIATLQQVTDRASEGSLISRWNLGTTGSTLVDAMNSLRRGLGGQPLFSLKTHSSKEDISSYLAQGRPVVAMIQVDGSDGFDVGSGIFRVSYTVPALHWIAITGFDSRLGRLYFTDTDGGAYYYSYADFDDNFHWDFGYISNKFLQGFGVVEGTFIV